MSKGNQIIAEAAITVISRYGMRKTTMSDIAQAAGVSRQTLYNAYANKEDVVRDAIRFVTESGISAVQEAWAEPSTLSQKLDSFFEIGPLAWFDLLQSSPDAADLIDGLKAAGHDEMAQGSLRWTQELTRLLFPFDDRLTAMGISAADVADMIFSTSSAAKTNSVTREQLQARLQTLKYSVLALTGEP